MMPATGHGVALRADGDPNPHIRPRLNGCFSLPAPAAALTDPIGPPGGALPQRRARILPEFVRPPLPTPLKG